MKKYVASNGFKTVRFRAENMSCAIKYIKTRFGELDEWLIAMV